MNRSKPLERRAELRVDPEKVREFQRRGRKSASKSMGKPKPISPASDAQRRKVRGRICANCGAFGPCDPAHLTARSAGGCDHPDCVISLCRICHLGLDERTGPEAGIDLSPILALQEFRAERAHMALHMSMPRCLRRLTGKTWAPIDNEEESDGTA